MIRIAAAVIIAFAAGVVAAPHIHLRPRPPFVVIFEAAGTWRSRFEFPTLAECQSWANTYISGLSPRCVPISDIYAKAAIANTAFIERGPAPSSD